MSGGQPKPIAGLVAGNPVSCLVKSKESVMQSAITAKGRITLPTLILDHLGVKPGDMVRFFIHPDGTVVILPTRPVTDLRGMIKYAGPPATIEEMDEAIADAAMERDLRSRQ